jgi:hypothetical protein
MEQIVIANTKALVGIPELPPLTNIARSDGHGQGHAF